jgi:hypothetical protein
MFVCFFFLAPNLTFQKAHWLEHTCRKKRKKRRKKPIVSGMGIGI